MFFFPGITVALCHYAPGLAHWSIDKDQGKGGKDKAKEKLRARAERGMLEDEFSSFDTEDFGELASLVGAEEEAEKQAAKRSEREQKKLEQ